MVDLKKNIMNPQTNVLYIMCMVLTVSSIYQGITTAGYCRYRQAIPIGQGGRLDVDSNFGLRKVLLPQV
jgi:hypothetical protein